MFTLEQCRKVLGDRIQLEDEELIALRTQLYSLARLAIEMADSAVNHRQDPDDAQDHQPKL